MKRSIFFVLAFCLSTLVGGNPSWAVKGITQMRNLTTVVRGSEYVSLVVGASYGRVSDLSVLNTALDVAQHHAVVGALGSELAIARMPSGVAHQVAVGALGSEHTIARMSRCVAHHADVGALGSEFAVRTPISFLELENSLYSPDDRSPYIKVLKNDGEKLDISLVKFAYNSYFINGLRYHSQGDYAKALEYYEKALDKCERLVPDHPLTATFYNNIGLVYDEQGNYTKALEYYEKALDIFERKLGPKHPDTMTVKINMQICRDEMQG